MFGVRFSTFALQRLTENGSALLVAGWKRRFPVSGFRERKKDARPGTQGRGARSRNARVKGRFGVVLCFGHATALGLGPNCLILIGFFCAFIG